MRAAGRWWWQMAVLWWRDPTEAWVLCSYYAYARASYQGRLVAWRRARPTFAGAFRELPAGYAAMPEDALQSIQREQGGTLWIVADPPAGATPPDLPTVEERYAVERLADVMAVAGAAGDAERADALTDPNAH